MEQLWTIRDIARRYGRSHSVVTRWAKDPRHRFPDPDFQTDGGRPLWRPATIREWVTDRWPVLSERDPDGA